MVQLINKEIYSILKTKLSDEQIIGFGSGEIINYIIEQMVEEKIKFKAVSSANSTIKHLHKLKVPVLDFGELLQIPIYISTFDVCNELNQTIHNSTENFTQEKIFVYNSKKNIGIKSCQNYYTDFNHSSIAVEVLPVAKSLVAREIIKLKGNPIYRNGVKTENSNIILDIHNLFLNNPIALENLLNTIPGIIDCSIFAKKPFDLII